MKLIALSLRRSTRGLRTWLRLLVSSRLKISNSNRMVSNWRTKCLISRGNLKMSFKSNPRFNKTFRSIIRHKNKSRSNFNIKWSRSRLISKSSFRDSNKSQRTQSKIKSWTANQHLKNLLSTLNSKKRSFHWSINDLAISLKTVSRSKRQYSKWSSLTSSSKTFMSKRWSS